MSRRCPTKRQQEHLSTFPTPNFFRCFRETTVIFQMTPVWQFVNSWNWSWISPGQLDFGTVPRRFNGINMWPVTFFQRPAVPLWLCCFFFVTTWQSCHCCWRLLGVLPFCGDFPGCGAIPISRCNTHLANTQNLQQQHTHISFCPRTTHAQFEPLSWPSSHFWATVGGCYSCHPFLGSHSKVRCASR